MRAFLPSSLRRHPTPRVASDAAAPAERRRYRPPVGVPSRDGRSWQGWAASLLLHVLLVLLVLVPVMTADFAAQRSPGGMGVGPVGGGGGSGGGSAARARFVDIAQSAEKTADVAKPVPLPPVLPTPTLTAEVTPPKQDPVAVQSTSLQAVMAASRGAGATGTGAAGGDGGGSGPGMGGGVGSGTGTGKGSASGAGTGGGDGHSYAPTVTQLFVPPLPAPERIKPYHLIAWFEVDSVGRARLLRFNRSSDGDYNKRLESVLRSLKFRPGVGPDGVPKCDTTTVEYIF